MEFFNEKKSNASILVVDDNEDILKALRILLKQYFEIVKTEKEPERIDEHFKEMEFDVLILDMNFSGSERNGAEGMLWLKKTLSRYPATSVVLITAYGEIDLAVQSIKQGAVDFIIKPWENEKLVATIQTAAKLSQSKREIQTLQQANSEMVKQSSFHSMEMIGESRSIQQVFSMARKVAKTDVNVLILGENGTGKELAARAIHLHSLRSHQPFIAVDMGAIPETLFESELFGYARGAFTDAKSDKPGRFELADGGTLFLDEIGNLSLSLQAKLLSALQNREIIRVGSTKHKKIDVRLICATNMPIHQMIYDQRFRQDLLYRINTVEINIPPLRERADDIPILLRHYLELYKRKYHKPLLGINPDIKLLLKEYSWPGNVRELQHAVERAVIMAESDELLSADFLIQSSHSSCSEEKQSALNLRQLEKNTILQVLKKNGGNISQTSKELGITRASLYRRLEKYGI